MIQNRSDLRYYLGRDRVAMGRTEKHPRVFGDVIWKYVICLRQTEYYYNCRRKSLLGRLVFLFLTIKRHHLAEKTGFEIGLNQCGPGLSIAHTGKVVFHKNASVGQNCRMVGEITLGATNGSTDAPHLGDNVFISVGARIIGGITIADDVAIAANAVVTKSIIEPGTTWGGIPARKISNHDSSANFPYLELMKGFVDNGK